MGVSWSHEVYFVVNSDESDYVNSLPERLPGPYHSVPVCEKSYDNNVVHLSSGGYNIFDIFGPEFPRPKSWTGVVHRISPCQGQDFDVVDWIDRTEFDDKYDDLDDEEREECLINPMDDYTDPGSEYWEENSHLNVLYETPDLMEDWDDSETTLDEDDREFDRRYDNWREQIYTTQTQDIQKGINHFRGT